jgi:hypothetical protein
VLQLERAFDKRSWHGTNLWGSLRDLTTEEVAWRPHPDRHNIWELAIHAAYWKYRVFRLVSERPPRAFELRGSNFFTRPAGGADWPSDRELLPGWHRRLVDAVEEFDEGRLAERVGNDWFTFQDLILGAAGHDLYHAGQIQLLKKLLASGSDAETT